MQRSVNIKVIKDANCIAPIIELQQQLYSSAEYAIKQQEAINDEVYYCTIIAEQENKVVACCVLYNNPTLMHNQKKCIAIGNWECIDDTELATMLMDKATQIANELNAAYIIGPMNGTTWDVHRYQIDGNQEPIFTSENLAKNYYAQQWQNAGYEILANYFSAKDTQLQLYKPEHLEKYKLQGDANGITIRNIHLANFENEIKSIYTFCCKAFQHNFLYTPISEKSFVEKYISILPILEEQYIWIAEDDKQVVALLFAFADRQCNTHKRMILKTIATLPEKRLAGVAFIMANNLLQTAKQNNFTSLIHAFMHQANESVISSKRYHTTNIRKYALWIKNV